MVDQSTVYDNAEVGLLLVRVADLEAALLRARDAFHRIGQDAVVEAVEHLSDIREARAESRREAFEEAATICDDAARAPTNKDAAHLAVAIRARVSR